MLRRIRSAARAKVQKAVAEVIRAESAEAESRRRGMHAEVLAALGRDGAQLERIRDDIHRLREDLRSIERAVGALEQRQRRDISYALDRRATEEAGAFVLEHMPKVAVFRDPHELLRYAVGQVQVAGLALEFGVAGGATLRIIAGAIGGDRRVVGFDTFCGLPETWRSGFPAGEFAQDAIPDVPGAALVAGMFEDTLPEFLAATTEPIAFLHLDADLYASAKTVLDLAGERLVRGTVIVFDEFFNYPGWQQHEYRAWTEFVARTGVPFDYLAYTANNEQVAVRLT
jgi:predicted O-methyltransferase YrrM